MEGATAPSFLDRNLEGVKVSADNWTHCPRCKYNKKKDYEEKVENLRACYGTVSLDEFEKRTKAVERCTPTENNLNAETFREDYEFYAAETGTLKIEYTGNCQECDLLCTFTHEVPFWSPPK